MGNVITNFFRLILAVVFLAVSAGAQAGFQEGMKAYVTGNYPVALKEFNALAIKGNAAAQFWLGWMYNDGNGVPQDYQLAMSWYRKAAEQGNMEAQFFLGEMYDKGHGVPQDYSQAAVWYRMAATQDSALAQHRLGVMYAYGLGCNRMTSRLCRGIARRPSREIWRRSSILG